MIFHAFNHFFLLLHDLKVLKPGGLLLFRDYGLYDMTQLRFISKRDRRVGENYYQRADGTRAFFFSLGIANKHPHAHIHTLGIADNKHMHARTHTMRTHAVTLHTALTVLVALVFTICICLR